jgi:hypothetical protein
MAANLLIRADVVDISIDLPQPDDVFMVDTNAWYWIAYSRLSQPKVKEKISENKRPKYYQTKYYPDYIKKAITSKAKLHYCGLTLSELAHNIETIEKDIFANDGGDGTLKEYRHNYPAERNNVVEQVETAWDMITTMGPHN